MKLPSMRTPLSIAVCGLSAAPAMAADLDVSVQIPQLDVAEYHRPYVAVWLKRGGGPGGPAAAAAGDAPKGPAPQAGGGEGGTKWLPDLRQWWRRTGRELTVPIDGVTGATRPVGEHKLSFSTGKAPLAELAPGKYKLVVEAAREDGGRELVDIPFEWPAAGKSELGAITLAIKP
jgi:hypothetical protein